MFFGFCFGLLISFVGHLANGTLKDPEVFRACQELFWASVALGALIAVDRFFFKPFFVRMDKKRAALDARLLELLEEEARLHAELADIKRRLIAVRDTPPSNKASDDG